MRTIIINKDISSRVIMAGNYYKNHHPGGISAVVQYWSEYIFPLQYYPTYKLSNIAIRVFWFVYSYVCIATRLFFDKKIQIMHLHTAADGSFWRKIQLLKLGKLMGCKVILHIHASRFKDYYEGASKKKKAWVLTNLKKADVVIVLSESWKSWFTNIGVPEYKIKILHNITPHPTLLSLPQTISCKKINILFLGEIGKRKGVFDVLKCICLHKESFDGRIEFRIGGNLNENILQKYINDNELEKIVKFDGWVGGEKKIQLLNWADIFILTSYNEGLPISILEAMSYGLPIIASPVGGIPEVVERNRNGILVNPGNIDEIYHAIMKYINSPEIIVKEGGESKKIVREYYPEFVLNDLKQIYESLLN